MNLTIEERTITREKEGKLVLALVHATRELRQHLDGVELPYANDTYMALATIVRDMDDLCERIEAGDDEDAGTEG